jgi:hypothetical protein
MDLETKEYFKRYYFLNKEYLKAYQRAYYLKKKIRDNYPPHVIKMLDENNMDKPTTEKISGRFKLDFS